ncbi:hypothetical protein GOBAR_AA27681 [Gossypium barbadense]|uniref:Uncharacterized protein n=1 Tax=Gossypium barbadense TaxID=3634 RepID=A0A2P5WPH5_GOSBA|nr:hypothetical protein GOBAR_AA27681 [Gossypium barbadense]
MKKGLTLIYEMNFMGNSIGGETSSIMADLPGYLHKLLTDRKTCGFGDFSFGRNHIANLVIMYVLLPMPLMFFAGSDGYSLLSESGNSWVNATKFLAGASAIGSIAIPAILKHAGVISWGALAMELSSFFVFCSGLRFQVTELIGQKAESDYGYLICSNLNTVIFP